MEKAKTLRTYSRFFEATDGQWWEKTKSGKTWRLWGYDEKGLLRIVHHIPARRVLWVVPIKGE